MGMINLDNAKEGMVIIEKIRNKEGNTLLEEGTTLTKELIDKLNSLGIPGVCVDKTDENDSPGKISPAISPELKELEYKFSNVTGNVIMEELLTAAKEYIKEKGSGDGTC